MLSLFVHKSQIKIHLSRFPAGETNLRLEPPASFFTQDLLKFPLSGLVTLKYESNDDLFNLLLLVDSAKRLFGYDLNLSLACTYLPYARQDRVCSTGESLSVKVIADLINSQNFDRVFCTDIHSGVGQALIDRLIHTEQHQLGRDFPITKVDILVSPDAGAEKKALTFAKHWSIPEVLYASKVRTSTYQRDFGLTNKTILVVDDICDGGRTFIELAKELKAVTTDCRLYLYVTHGIFSKGVGVFDNLYDHIYTSNLMGDAHPLLTVIN